MDFLQENKSFVLCSLCTVVCLYSLLRISLENYKSLSQPSQILKFKKKPNKSEKKDKNHNGNTPKLPLPRMHLYQRKLDVYVNDMNVINTTKNYSSETKKRSYVYKICLTGGPNSGKTTSKIMKDFFIIYFY